MEIIKNYEHKLTPEEKWEQATLANNMSSFKSPDGLLKLFQIYLKNRNAMRFLRAS